MTNRKNKIKAPKVNDIDYKSIKLLTGSDLSIRRLPLMTVKSKNPGPTVWLTACAHGDEVGGMAIIQEIFKKIKRNPLKNGILHSFPLMNPIGFETASRDVTLTDEDLNRSFKGSSNGSVAERIADKIFTTIKDSNPDLVLDLHNDWRKSIPYTVIDKIPNETKKEIKEKTLSIANVIGFPIINEEKGVDKSLTFNLLKENIPAITLELGESYMINERNVLQGVNAIWNVLVELKMVEPMNNETDMENKIESYKYYQEPLCSRSGIIRFKVKPGQFVKKGEVLAKIYNAFGRNLDTLEALKDGLVLGHYDSSVVFPGIPIIAFGVKE